MSRMPTFGPGPGQYQSQTTFNPVMQPTIEVARKQSLFAQIAGLMPAIAETAGKVIDYDTKLKEQQYLQEEAIVENLAVQSGNPRLLENFYADQLSKTGRIPPSIRRAALTGQAQAIEKVEKDDAVKYSLELSQGLVAIKSAKNPEEYTQAQESFQSSIARGKVSPSTLMQQLASDATSNLLDLDSAREKAIETSQRQLALQQNETQQAQLSFGANQAQSWAMTGNSVRAAQALQELTKRFGYNSDGSPNYKNLDKLEQARQEILTATTTYQNRIKTEEQSKITQANTLAKDLTSTVKQLFKDDPRMLQEFNIRGERFLQALYSDIASKIPGLASIQWGENGLPSNDPYLANSIAYEQALLGMDLIGDVNKQNKTEIEAKTFNNLNSAIQNAASDPMSVVNTVQNAAEYMKGLSPEEQQKFQSKLDTSISQGFTGVAQLVATNQIKPVDALRSYYIISSNLQNTVQFGSQVAEAKRLVETELRKSIADDVFIQALELNPDVDPSFTLTTMLPVKQNIESGLFELGQSARQDRPSEEAYTVGKSLYFNYLAKTGSFTQEEIDKAESLGSFESLLRNDNPARNDLVNIVKESYNNTISSKLKDRGMSMTPKDLLEFQRRGIPLTNDENNKLRFPTQQLDGQVSIDQTNIWDVFGYDNTKVKNLMSNPDPGLDADRTNLFVRVAQSDVSRLNGQPVNEKLISYHIDNLRSEDSIKKHLGAVSIAVYGGFKNPGIRAALNNGKLKIEDVSVIAQIQNKMTVSAAGVYTLTPPNGVTIPAMIESFRTISQTATTADTKDSAIAKDLGFDNGVIASGSMLSTIKQLYNVAQVYSPKDPAPIVNSLLNSMGYVIDERDNQQGVVIPDVMSTYTQFDQREDEITRIFNTVIPENYRQDYADYFGRTVDENWNTIGDLIALKLNIDKARLWDLNWGYSYDSTNGSLYMDRMLGDFTARTSFMLGGHLMWQDDDGNWNAVYGTDPNTNSNTPVRFNPRFTAKFPITSAKEIRESLPLTQQVFLAPGETARSATISSINAVLGIPASYFGSKFANMFNIREGNIQGRTAVDYRQLHESANVKYIPISR